MQRKCLKMLYIKPSVLALLFSILLYLCLPIANRSGQAFAQETGLNESQPWLGVEVANIPEQDGVKITQIDADGPAAETELKIGMIIKKLDGKPISSRDVFFSMLSYYKVGEIIILTIEKDDGENELHIQIGAEPSYLFRFNNAIRHIKNGQVDSAIVELKESIRIYPYYDDAHAYLGVLYEHTGQSEKAIQELQIAIQIDSTDAWTHKKLADAYSDSGLYDNAIEEYQIAIRLEPKYSEAYAKKGNSFRRKANYAETLNLYRKATKAIEKAVQLDRNNPESREALANIYLERGLVEKAIEQYNAALILNPELESKYYNKAFSYMLGAVLFLIVQESPPEMIMRAEVILRALTKFKPGNAEYWYLLGQVYLADGRLGRAISCFRRAVQKDREAGKIEADSSYEAALENTNKKIKDKLNRGEYEVVLQNLLEQEAMDSQDSQLRKQIDWCRKMLMVSKMNESGNYLKALKTLREALAVGDSAEHRIASIVRDTIKIRTMKATKASYENVAKMEQSGISLDSCLAILNPNITLLLELNYLFPQDKEIQSILKEAFSLKKRMLQGDIRKTFSTYHSLLSIESRTSTREIKKRKVSPNLAHSFFTSSDGQIVIIGNDNFLIGRQDVNEMSYEYERRNVALNAALELRKSDLLELAKEQIVHGDYNEAVRIYKNILAHYPDSEDAQEGLANTYIKKAEYFMTHEMYDAAIELCNNALKLLPDFVKAQAKLGKAYLYQGRYDESINAYRRTIALNPEFKDAHAYLGWIYRRQGKYAEAIRELENAIRIDSVDAWNYKVLADAFADSGMYDKAVKEYGYAIRLRSDYIDAYANLGWVYHRLKRYDEAIEELRIAVKLDSLNARNHMMLANTYAASGRYNEAVNVYRYVITINPENFDALRLLGYCYDELGESKEAILTYKNMIELFPDDGRGYNSLAYLYAEQEIKLDTALVLINIAIEKGREQYLPYYYDTRGWVYYKIAKRDNRPDLLDKALADIERAELTTSEEQQDVLKEVYYHKGCLYMRMGNLEKAREYVSKALSIDPGYEKAIKLENDLK